MPGNSKASTTTNGPFNADVNPNAQVIPYAQLVTYVNEIKKSNDDLKKTVAKLEKSLTVTKELLDATSESLEITNNSLASTKKELNTLKWDVTAMKLLLSSLDKIVQGIKNSYVALADFSSFKTIFDNHKHTLNGFTAENLGGVDGWEKGRVYLNWASGITEKNKIKHKTTGYPVAQ